MPDAKARDVQDAERPERVMQRTIDELLAEHTTQWMSIPAVVGTAQGLNAGKPCIKVYVTERTPELDRRIPKRLEGYSVIMEVTGAFRPKA